MLFNISLMQLILGRVNQPFHAISIEKTTGDSEEGLGLKANCNLTAGRCWAVLLLVLWTLDPLDLGSAD